MGYTKIRLDFQSEAAVITIDNPPANALHPLVADEILNALADIAGHAGVRGVVITGRGGFFVAGGDIAYFTELDASSAETYALRIQAMQAALQDCPLPVIAAVNGYALGGGCELMMACDMRVADEGASFGQPEVKLGLIPGAGGTQNLPRLVPLGQAKRMLFTGQRIGAARALQIGLVDEVVSAGTALQAALDMVREIAQCAPLAVAQAKRAVNLGMRMSAADALRLEAALFADLFRTADVKEGIRAFAEKRAPQFRGR